MKKRLLILLLLLCVVLSACGKTNVNKPDDSPANPDTQTKIDYTAKYEAPLAAVYEFIKNIDSKVGPDDGMNGIWDAANALGVDALREIGYIFKDLNGDDVSELLIGAFNKADEAFTNNEIYMIYVLKNDKPELILEGWARSMYSLKDNGKLFHMGSNGAAYSIFGIYNVSNNNELMCEDFYFTYPADNDPAKCEIYHNETGIYYREEAEKLDISSDDFWALQEEAAKGTVKLSATPFAELNAEIVEKALAEAPAPEPEMFLGGEWILSSVEVEGSKWTPEEAGIQSEISIDVPSFTASFFSKTEFVNNSFDAKLELLEEPIYEGCGNDEWKVKFITYNSTYGENEEFYATLIDEKTLLLQHFYPFDGAQGVSYQTYTRK